MLTYVRLVVDIRVVDVNQVVPGKAFAHVVLGRQPLLHRQQRPKQSGFTAARSTADAILALRLLSELYRKFSKPLDIKAAFDSVDREALWKALQAKHVPPFLISFIKDLHTGIWNEVMRPS